MTCFACVIRIVIDCHIMVRALNYKMHEITVCSSRKRQPCFYSFFQLEIPRGHRLVDRGLQMIMWIVDFDELTSVMDIGQ